MTPRDVPPRSPGARREPGRRAAPSARPSQPDGRIESESPRPAILELTEQYLDAVECHEIASAAEKPKWARIVAERRARIVAAIGLQQRAANHS